MEPNLIIVPRWFRKILLEKKLNYSRRKWQFWLNWQFWLTAANVVVTCGLLINAYYTLQVQKELKNISLVAIQPQLLITVENNEQTEYGITYFSIGYSVCNIGNNIATNVCASGPVISFDSLFSSEIYRIVMGKEERYFLRRDSCIEVHVPPKTISSEMLDSIYIEGSRFIHFFYVYADLSGNKYYTYQIFQCKFKTAGEGHVTAEIWSLSQKIGLPLNENKLKAGDI